MKRWARSYSIVDHKLLHDGYLEKLSHESLALYLFYVVVGDCEGRSYYSEEKVRQILRLSFPVFVRAKEELMRGCLIRSHKPYVWVSNLDGNNELDKRNFTKEDSVSKRRSRTKLPTNRGGDWSTTAEVLTSILRGAFDSSATDENT